MNSDLHISEHGDEVLSSRVCAPMPTPLRQRLALSALVVGASLWIRVVELSDARRASTTQTRLEKS